MRLRFDKDALPTLQASSLFIEEPKTQYFSNPNPLMLEIGMGKGDFIIQNAELNPHLNYIGIEKFPTVQLNALKKIKRLEKPLDNLKLMAQDALTLKEWFAPNSVHTIYLNFSDPWPKARHQKRRLTHSSFLDIYQTLLINGGLIEIKTDQQPLYEFTLEMLALRSDFKLMESSTNYHQSHTKIIKTEYEIRFTNLGHPIYYLKIKKMFKI